MRSKLYVIHNTADKAARGEVSLHLNAFPCPSPIKERKWGWIWRVSPGCVPPSKATLPRLNIDRTETEHWQNSIHLDLTYLIERDMPEICIFTY